LSQDAIVQSEPGYAVVGELSHLKINSDAQARTLIKQLDALHMEMLHAVSVISGVQATTSAEKSGQTDWVDGATQAAGGVHSLAAALTDVINGEKSAASSALKKVASQDLAAEKLTAAADKLLGLPAGD